MSDHELTEDEREINVLDTDSRLSHSDSEPRSPRSHCSSPENVPQSHPSTNTTLPFSISNLLGKNFEEKSESEVATSFYEHQSGLLQNRGALAGFMPSGFYGQGVLRVPAHRPLSGLLQNRGALAGFMPSGFYGQGVLRVPAHRPLGGGSPGAVFAPWTTLGLDPVLQRSAAAAAFASQVVKDRLAGRFVVCTYVVVKLSLD
ncbi:hypothetical protein QE152_g23385 [Popillia japonica]|uniref:Uncharacterized protein n=1 Tax=Popillia japonica TaxID=7064 RepID=A0AAW1KH57_POPJA